MKKRKDLFGEGNKIASEYELLNMAIPHMKEIESQVGVELLKKFNKEDKIKILDVGSGTGLTTEEIFKALPLAHVVAVDLEDSMVDQAKAKEPKGDVEYVVKDILEYLKEKPDNSFDAVVSAFVLHNIECIYRDKIIIEIYRVLSTEGLFINVDKMSSDDPEVHKASFAEQKRRWSIFGEAGMPELQQEWSDHYDVDNKPELVLVEGVYKKRLVDAGFVDIATTYRELMDAVVVAKKA